MKTIGVKIFFILLLLSTAIRSLPAEMEQARKNLFAAAGRGDLAEVKAARAKGADVTAEDGYRPLAPAAANGYLELTKVPGLRSFIRDAEYLGA